MQKELCQGLKEEVMASNNFDETMAALFKGMDGFITSKTVVGDAIKLQEREPLPVSRRKRITG